MNTQPEPVERRMQFDLRDRINAYLEMGYCISKRSPLTLERRWSKVEVLANGVISTSSKRTTENQS